jgi:uncharacterized protein (DUF362 family)/Pyruvate/2-oxoacid:ferredoxin oxidoreductase delta subunit
MSKVAIVRCESYEIGEVTRAVERGINLIGGINSFAKKGEKILLKPNWLAASAPEKCVVTHPVVFEAVAEIFKAAGAILSYGDSPAFQSPEMVAKAAGFTAPASRLGIELADFRSGEDVVYEFARQNKQFNIAKGALVCDGMVSIPKLKTHGFLKLTGAVKNQFGCIPGIQKAEFHLKLTSSLDFAKMLVDLTALLKPRLYVMDGIIAMEGNGPRGGTPRKLGVLLLSADPIALDATVCRMLCVKPELSHTVSIGKEFELGTYLENEIEITGDPIPDVTFADFRINRGSIPKYRESGGIPKFFTNMFVPRPFIVPEKCIKCGDCVTICPPRPKALDWHDGDTTKVPTYDYDKCIRCYCCQEICSRGAIELKIPFIRKLSGGIHRVHGRRITGK